MRFLKSSFAAIIALFALTLTIATNATTKSAPSEGCFALVENSLGQPVSPVNQPDPEPLGIEISDVDGTNIESTCQQQDKFCCFQVRWVPANARYEITDVLYKP